MKLSLPAAMSRLPVGRLLPDSLVRKAIEVLPRAVSPLGWGVLGLAAVCWVGASTLGWAEAGAAAMSLAALFGLCVLRTLGRTRLRVELELTPSRLLAGGTATGQLTITNLAPRRLLPIAFELPIGAGGTRFALPPLPAGGSHEELFMVPGRRRGVIPVGPATSVRGDPFGLLRRTVPWAGVRELLVHPLTVPLEPLGAGILRDLEGQSTNEVSMSDLAFHTLRDYAPGDDRRYIHWRSSAKVGAGTPGGRFLVRQFLDTRRSHLTVVLDTEMERYPDSEDFETACSAAGSILIRSVRDEQDTSVVAGGYAVGAGSGRQLLDVLARISLGSTGLDALAQRAVRTAPDTSLLVLISGARTAFTALRRAAAFFPAHTRKVAIVVDGEQPTGLQAAGSLTVLTLPRLADLPALLEPSGITRSARS